MKLDSLNKLYIEQLKDIYSAENQLVAALPKMAKAASSPELQQAFLILILKYIVCGGTCVNFIYLFVFGKRGGGNC